MAVTIPSDWLAQIPSTLWHYHVPQVTVAKKHSEFMGGFKALKAAVLPTCDLNKFIHPRLQDNSKPIHMIVTTPDRFDTCYLKQKQGSPMFQRGGRVRDKS
ncbi:hypothetical protein WJX82_006838 [Trebouxia sp. C0006]